MTKLKRVKNESGVVKLFKDVDIIDAVREIQQVLEQDGRKLEKKILPDKAGYLRSK